MKYKHTLKAEFISRKNRFVADVLLDGKVEAVHVKNTGRCKELLLPGAQVTLQRVIGEKRKTNYDLISVYKPGLGWVNIDSQAPNAVAAQWLREGTKEFAGLSLLKPECRYGTSRFDFYLECGERKVFLEVKGCTLEVQGKGYFPDAPTQRGIKHLMELAKACGQGFECYLLFLIAMPKVELVYPNVQTHPEFEQALRQAVAAGVKILYLSCDVDESSLRVRACRAYTDVE